MNDEKMIVKLDAEQHNWLLQRLDYEFTEELIHQSRNDVVNTDYLDMILSIYKELLYAMDNYDYERLISDEMIAEMQKDIDKLIEEKTNEVESK